MTDSRWAHQVWKQKIEFIKSIVHLKTHFLFHVSHSLSVFHQLGEDKKQSSDDPTEE